MPIVAENYCPYCKRKIVIEENKSKLFMNTIDREDYKCLNACTNYTRAEITSYDEKGQTDFRNKCPAHVDKRLVDKGFINWKGRSRNIITDNGRKELNRLEVIKWRFWTYVSGIVIAICAVITLGRFLKWW